MDYKGEPISDRPNSWVTVEDLRDNLVTQLVFNSDYKNNTGSDMPPEVLDGLIGTMTRMALAIYKGDMPDGDINDPTVYTNFYYLNNNLYYRIAKGDSITDYTKIWDSNNSNNLENDWYMKNGFIYQSLSSSNYAGGFTGFGWEIDEFGNAVFDSLTVRKTLSVYELLIEKIRSINGGIVTSVANGVVDRLVDNIVYLKDDFTTFVVGDRVRSQKFTGRGTKYYEAEVTELVADNAIRLENFIGDYYPEPGDELVQWGNINDESRQSFLYQTARDGGYFSVLTGVDSDDLEDKEVVRLGNIDSIVTTTWGPLSGYGIYVKGDGYFEDVYISGNIVVTGGNAATHDDVSNAVIDFSSLLGDLAYEDLIEYAKLGDTIIEGGHIKTSLIDVSQITVTVSQIEDLGLLASKDTVEWGTDINSIPSYLQSTAPDNSLSITATFLGFHEVGDNWPIRIANDGGVGKFYAGDGTQYMSWDGSILTVTGNLIQSTINPAWQFNADGTGQIANNNISWDSVGNITFTNDVNISWNNLIDTPSSLSGYGVADVPASVISGTLGVSHGGTGKSSVAVNSMIYASVNNAYSEVSTSSFGRGVLNSSSGVTVVGFSSDMLDNFHSSDFMRYRNGVTDIFSSSFDTFFVSTNAASNMPGGEPYFNGIVTLINGDSGYKRVLGIGYYGGLYTNSQFGGVWQGYRVVWDSANSNLLTVDWNAQNLNLNGNITSGYYYLNNTVTNPYFRVTESGNTYYVQGYQNKLALGPTFANSIQIDQNGNVTIPHNFGFPTFISGIFGTGWRFDYNNSVSNESYLEIDNIMVRNTFRTHIFEKDVVKVTNGMLYVSDSIQISSVTGTTGTGTITVDDSKSASFISFPVQFWFKDMNSSNVIKSVKFNLTGINTASNGTRTIYNITWVSGDSLQEIPSGGVAVRTSGGGVLLDAVSVNSPYVDAIVDGTVHARYGNLAGVSSLTWGTLTGYGLWSDNVYLEGKVVATSGYIGTITDGWSITQDRIVKSISTPNGSMISFSTKNGDTGNEYYYGGNWLQGLMFTWHQANNAGHIVMGQMAYNSTSKKTGYYGLQMMDHVSREVFALGANANNASKIEYYCRIAGFAFSNDIIYSTNLTGISDGSTYTTTGMVLGYTGYIATPNFRVTTSGNLYAQNAYISGEVNATIGNIASFVLSPQGLTTTATDSSGYVRLEYSGGYFVRIGGSPTNLMQLRADNRTAISIYTDSASGTGISITAQTGARAIDSYGNHSFTARSGETIDFYGPTYIADKLLLSGGVSITGIHFGTSSSTTTVNLTNEELHFYFSGTGTTTVRLPSTVTAGEIHMFRRVSGGTLIISGNGRLLHWGSGDTGYTYTIPNSYDLFIAIWEGVYWNINYIPRA